MSLEEFALNLIVELVGGSVFEGIQYKTSSILDRRKIERRVKFAVEEVVDPLLPFLTQEHVPEEKNRRLIEACIEELRPLTKQTERLFHGSLDGQKIFDELYKESPFPQVVVEDGVENIYAILFPRIATLICKLPVAVKDWESEAWSENYRRFDDLKHHLVTLLSKVDGLTTAPTREADELLAIVNRTLSQKARFQIDLTGLRGDYPFSGKFDDFFVQPELEQNANMRFLSIRTEGKRSFSLPSDKDIIFGGPGAGKSTWTKWLHLKMLAEHPAKISVRVELRHLISEPLVSLLMLIKKSVGVHLAENITEKQLRQWLVDEKIVIILDGFDEIPLERRDEIIEWITELKIAFLGCSIVLTSRPLSTEHLNSFGDWIIWNMVPFDFNKILDYIHRWYKFVPLLNDSERTINAKVLAQSWLGDEVIAPLAGNPLLLSTLLMVHHLDGRLPSGRSQLYKRYVEGMLGLWDDRRQVSTTTIKLSLEQKRMILRALAVNMFFKEIDDIDETSLIDWLQRFLSGENILSSLALPVLETLRERSGLIIGPGIYSFAHKSIAEYLIAEAIIQGERYDEERRKIDHFYLYQNRKSDRWNSVTFLWAGLASVGNLEEFINQCIDADDMDLACGILYDQFERIPNELRQRLLLKILSIDIFSAVNFKRFRNLKFESFTWIFSRPATISDESLRFSTFRLRSASNSVDFSELINKAISENALLWLDHTQAQGMCRDLLWMQYALNTRNATEWINCLSSPPFSPTSVELWMFWVAERLCLNYIKLESKNLEATLNTYRETYPQSQEFLSILLLSSIQCLIRKELTQESYIHITKLVDLLLNTDQAHLAVNWLLGTREWILGPIKPSSKKIGDLLTISIKTINELIDNKHVEKSLGDRAVEYIEEMRRHRDRLYNPKV
jgi:hypothetical protein